MEFSRIEKIKFKHCDPAGIVFYPRYFEMLNDLVEDWFEFELDLPFVTMHLKENNMGVPAVNIKSDFIKTSCLGDVIQKKLSVIKLGKSSCKLQVEFVDEKNSVVNVRFNLTLVAMNLDTKTARLWNEDLIYKINKFIKDKELA